MGKLGEEQRTLGKLQMKSLFGKSLPSFPNPILLLGHLAQNSLPHSVLLSSPAYFLYLLSDNYSFTSFCIIAHCLAFSLNFFLGRHFVWERSLAFSKKNCGKMYLPNIKWAILTIFKGTIW